ncbi:hypothetical protein CYY_005049 [Polysphondylium violaceum]|uniref:Enoyl-CoA hydratase/isomerase domain-containing protein n=1 Tax=Polysphondylium violaceum TaxID=133409 RepID=A0A8J4PU51_9MYCE|nr:hypothetical protein CYY_005049 [Polysphondylium violaceum]
MLSIRSTVQTNLVEYCSTTVASRNYATMTKAKKKLLLSKRGNSNTTGVFGKKIDFRSLSKVDPIQPKPYQAQDVDISNDQKLANLATYQDTTPKFHYSPTYAKLGTLTELKDLPENWDEFEYRPKNIKDLKGFIPASEFKIPMKSKIEMSKGASGLSTPFPRFSGNSPPLVAIPSFLGTRYIRGMINNKKQLNVLDHTTLNLIEQFFKVNIANECISSFSIHTTSPGIVHSSGMDFLGLYENRNNQKYIVDYFKKISKLFHLMTVTPKPHISILDGLASGAGTAFTANSGFRVVTENSIFSVPDCAIGFFPNAGNVKFLNRLPGKVGLYLALTGRRLRGVELVQCGIGNFYIPTSRIKYLEEALSRVPERDHYRMMVNLSTQTEPFQLERKGMEPTHFERYREAIKRCFSYKDIDDILGALQHESQFFPENAEWAKRCIANIKNSNPLSIKITMQLFNESPSNLKSSVYFERDYNLSMSLISQENSDLWEGIRARLIYNREPVWKYKSLDEVTQEIVDQHFNYEPTQQADQLKLKHFKSTNLMFETFVDKYISDNQVELNEKDEIAFSTLDRNPFTSEYEDFIKVFYSGAHNLNFYRQKTYQEVMENIHTEDLN